MSTEGPERLRSELRALQADSSSHTACALAGAAEGTLRFQNVGDAPAQRCRGMRALDVGGRNRSPRRDVDVDREDGSVERAVGSGARVERPIESAESTLEVRASQPGPRPARRSRRDFWWRRVVEGLKARTLSSGLERAFERGRCFLVRRRNEPERQQRSRRHRGRGDAEQTQREQLGLLAAGRVFARGGRAEHRHHVESTLLRRRQVRCAVPGERCMYMPFGRVDWVQARDFESAVRGERLLGALAVIVQREEIGHERRLRLA